MLRGIGNVCLQRSSLSIRSKGPFVLARPKTSIPPRTNGSALPASLRPQQRPIPPSSGSTTASATQGTEPSTLVVISSTGVNLGPHSYAKAQTLFDPATHKLITVDARQDPPVWRIVPLKKGREGLGKQQGKQGQQGETSSSSSPSSSSSSSTFVKPRKNEQITAETVRVVRETTGEDLGTMSLADALSNVNRRTEDLIVANPASSSTEEVPVCHIVTHESQQRARASARATRLPAKKPAGSVLATKELEIGTTISQHDFDIKVGRARTFLEQRHRVLFTVTDKRNGKSRELLSGVVKALDGFGNPVAERVGDRGRKTTIDFSPIAVKKKP